MASPANQVHRVGPTIVHWNSDAAWDPEPTKQIVKDACDATCAGVACVAKPLILVGADQTCPGTCSEPMVSAVVDATKAVAMVGINKSIDSAYATPDTSCSSLARWLGSRAGNRRASKLHVRPQ